MQTHMKNTRSQLIDDVVSNQQFVNHVHFMHKDIKPYVVTRRPVEHKVVNNNKVTLNNNPNSQMHFLFKKLYTTKYSSKINNKPSHKPIRPYTATKAEKFIATEHAREKKSLQNRITNCKSINQRKKDKNDPIVNPSYLIRPSQQITNVIIDKYSQKILNKNRPKSAVPSTNNKKNIKKQDQFFSKNKNSSQNTKNKQEFTDLPICTLKGILNYIVQNTIFKDADLKVLYFRLCRCYGEQNVDKVWQEIMNDLQK